jgi:hypothetical protein
MSHPKRTPKTENPATRKELLKVVRKHFVGWCPTCRDAKEIIPAEDLAAKKKPISYKAGKEKGNRFQVLVQTMIAASFSLSLDDVTVVGGGRRGKDIILSEKARKAFPFPAPEATCRENLNIWSKLDQAKKHTKGKPILIFSRNWEGVWATVDFWDLLELLQELLDLRRKRGAGR